jgi:hypothetical protein
VTISRHHYQIEPTYWLLATGPLRGEFKLVEILVSRALTSIVQEIVAGCEVRHTVVKKIPSHPVGAERLFVSTQQGFQPPRLPMVPEASVSADPVAKPAAHTRAESRGSGPSKVDAAEGQTLRNFFQV